jgi:hypothetical protein
MESLFDKQLDGRIGYLASSAIHQLGIFNLGGYIFGSTELLHRNLMI